MSATLKRLGAALCAVCLFAGGLGAAATAEGPRLAAIPRIDSSTARVPITDALYALLRDKYGLDGPAPICSKTHGAWLNLADGKADLLFTVAPTEDEFQYFKERGVGIDVKVFGYDGLVFVGNGDNPVQGLSADQIRAIYRGELTNWSTIPGGEDAPIDAYIRNAESGSQRLFEQLVWAGRDMPDFAALGMKLGEIESVASAFELTNFDDMEGIVEGVALNRHAIGFNIMSYVDDKFLNPPESVYDGEWLVRATGDVNLRDGPGLSHGTVGTLKKGEALPSLGEVREDERGVYWHRARHDALGEVWVSEKFSDTEPVIRSKIKLFDIDGSAPTTEHFASGKYPFVTTSIVAIRADEPEDSPARRLFDWIGSDESRALIEANSTLAVSFSEPYAYTGAN